MTRQPAAKVRQQLGQAFGSFGRALVVEFRAMYLPWLKPAPTPPGMPQWRASYPLAGALPSIPDPHNVAKCQLCVAFARMNTERPVDPRE